MPAVRLVELPVHLKSNLKSDLIGPHVVLGNGVVACTLVDSVDSVLVLEHSLRTNNSKVHKAVTLLLNWSTAQIFTGSLHALQAVLWKCSMRK